jgi:hypothetical protein
MKLMKNRNAFNKAVIEALEKYGNLGSPREPSRIPSHLREIEGIWMRFPDLRLGQLLCCAVGQQDRLFNIEDDQLIKELEQWMKDVTE